MSSFTYVNAVTALTAIQEVTSNPTTENHVMFNIASALIHLTGALQSDLAAIRQDIQELQQLARESQHP